MTYIDEPATLTLEMIEESITNAIEKGIPSDALVYYAGTPKLPITVNGYKFVNDLGELARKVEDRLNGI